MIGPLGPPLLALLAKGKRVFACCGDVYSNFNWKEMEAFHDKSGSPVPILGYDVKDKKLVVNAAEAEQVRLIFREYLASKSTLQLIRTLQEKGIHSKSWISTSTGTKHNGGFYSKGMLYKLLHNRTYIGEVPHKGKSYPGEHAAIVDKELFNKAQEKLSANDTKNEDIERQTHGLLKGLVFDSDGGAYSPACSRRKGKKPGQDRFHRYYVSQRAIREGYDTVEVRKGSGGLHLYSGFKNER